MRNMVSRTYFFVLLATVGQQAHAASLRSSSSSRTSTTVDSNATLSIGRSRTLQQQTELSEDGKLLNELIKVVLPLINAGIAKYTPDPLDLNIAGALEVGSLNFGCGDTSLDFTYNWGGALLAS